MNDAQIEAARRAWIDDMLMTHAGTAKPKGYQLRSLLDDYSMVALPDAAAAEAEDPYSDDWGRAFDHTLTRGAWPIFDLKSAVTNFDLEVDNRNDGTVWTHKSWVIDDVKAKRIPGFDRRQLEATAGSYISSKYKFPALDRAYVDALVALEYYQFADSVFNAAHVPIIAPSLMKRRPIFEYVANIAMNIVGAVTIYLILWGLSAAGLFPERWLFGAALILFGLVAVSTFLGLIFLPRQWLAVAKVKKNWNAILLAMRDVYSALDSAGPVSIRHFRSLVDKSVSLGVIWPAPLFVLMDDIEARSGRF